MGEIPFIHEQIYGVIVTHKYNKNMRIHNSNNVKDYYSMSLKKDAKKESAKILEERWPNLFNYDDPKPVIVGLTGFILKQAKDQEEKALLRRALGHYFRRVKYTYCVINNTHRYDLDGNISSEITVEEQAYTQNILNKFNKKKNEAKEAKEAKEANVLSLPKLQSNKKTPAIVIKKKRTVQIPN